MPSFNLRTYATQEVVCVCVCVCNTYMHGFFLLLLFTNLRDPFVIEEKLQACETINTIRAVHLAYATIIFNIIAENFSYSMLTQYASKCEKDLREGHQLCTLA